eukprot:Hpha_TRINITY_DN14213_c0_g1::TRINITY_DN14213_c0_g1_i1::g.22453::m.22453/K09553/STIP1; stress-induced-phosphoprotein 1
MSTDWDDDSFWKRLLTLGIGAVCVLVLWKDLRNWVLRQLHGRHLDTATRGAGERGRDQLRSVSAEVGSIRLELAKHWEGWVQYLRGSGVDSWEEVLSWEEGDLLSAADAFFAQTETQPVHCAKAKAALRDWHRRKGDRASATPGTPASPAPAAARASAESAKAADEQPRTEAAPAPAAAPAVASAPAPAAASAAAPAAARVEELPEADGGKGEDLDDLLDGALDDMDAEENIVDQAWDKITDSPYGPRALSTEVQNPFVDFVQKSVNELTTGLREQKKRRESERRAQETLDKQNMLKAQSMRLRGNDAFRAAKYEDALELYTEAIKLDSKDSTPEIYSNRSAAHNKLGLKEEALKDAQKCIDLRPDFPKGFSRKAEALEALGRWDQAKATWVEISTRFPDLPWKDEVVRRIEKCEVEAAADDILDSTDSYLATPSLPPARDF